LGKNVRLNRLDKKHYSSFGLSPIAVKYICRIAPKIKTDRNNTVYGKSAKKTRRRKFLVSPLISRRVGYHRKNSNEVYPSFYFSRDFVSGEIVFQPW